MHLEIFHECPLLQLNKKERSQGTSKICCRCSHTGPKCFCLGRWYLQGEGMREVFLKIKWFLSINFEIWRGLHHILKTIIITIITASYVLWTLLGILHQLSHFILIMMLSDIWSDSHFIAICFIILVVICISPLLK